jgi:microsomal dipeptidase-like Zn-dependent dipeptidase
MTLFRRTWTLPEAAPAATSATIRVSLQFCTTPFKVPGHTWPLSCAAPKPVPNKMRPVSPDGADDMFPQDMEDVSTIPNLVRGPMERGLSDADILKIGRNTLSVMRAVE